ncbi:MAG TPA: thiamine ABC transporter permease [Alphaproteobacteria bacterium]|nr:thiamine ABC transporter permease [Alphaproteobacteria bacterium]
MKNKGNIRRFLPYYKPYRKTLVFDLFCAALTTVCELVLPMIVRQITQVATTDLTQLTLSFILRCGTLYFVLRIMDALAYYYMSSVGHIMGTHIETDLRRDLFGHLEKLSCSYYDNAKIGTLMSRITSDLFDVTEFAHHCPEEFFIAGIKIAVSFVLLCTMNWKLTLVVFAVLPPMLWILNHFNHKLRAAFRESRKKIAELNAGVEDSLLGIRVVKSFTGEDIEREKFEKGNRAFFKVKAQSYYAMGGFHATTRFFDGIMYMLIVVLGAWFMKRGELTVPDFTAYLLFVSTLLTSVRRIVEFTEQFQRGMTGIERFFEIMDVSPAITDRPDAEELKDVKGKITLENVNFRYSSENDEVLKDFSMAIEPGQCVALVGPSGGGKTTVSSLIPRFYEIDGGKITIDGKDIRSLTVKSLRRNIGIVQQDVYLFSGSVKENIAYGKPDASDYEIVSAAVAAHADGFIKRLPDGYDTVIGEDGGSLSQGQKQLLCIARAMLPLPSMLILDEATSSIDTRTEIYVQKAFDEMMKGRTSFVVAHRLSTIRRADLILVMDSGRVVERGTHAELLEKGGFYANLYNSQFNV